MILKEGKLDFHRKSITLQLISSAYYSIDNTSIYCDEPERKSMLIHLTLDKMAAISQTTFSDAFS